MLKTPDAELTLAFVTIFENIAAVRGLLCASGHQEAVFLLDDAAHRIRIAMQRSERAPTGRP